MADMHQVNQGVKSLVVGFILSAALMGAMYLVATQSSLTGFSLTLTLLGMGSLLGLVQLICFLHLGTESKPHWNMITFLFMALIVVIIVGGSLWIMHSLDYQMM